MEHVMERFPFLMDGHANGDDDAGIGLGVPMGDAPKFAEKDVALLVFDTFK